MQEKYEDPDVSVGVGATLAWDPSHDRCEYSRDGELIGLVGYRILSDSVVEVLHTVVEERFGRQGYARAMVTAFLDQARSQNLAIVPTCTYLRRYLRRFPQSQDILAPGVNLGSA